MANQVRFIIRVEADWKVTITCSEEDGWQEDRDLHPVKSEELGDYPRPPFALHTPGDPHVAADTEAEVNTIHEIYRSILARDTRADQLALYGHYLFDALLGTDLWATMQQKTEQHGGKIVELALSWSADDLYLQRLNWELMHSDAGYLAAGTRKLRVAFTRLVKTEEPLSASQLSVPPRVLFVVGTSITDEEIRPGAELHGLLRRARAGRAMRYRVLERATPEQIREAVKAFDPEIVHLVCHGGIDLDTGRVYLELQTDDQDADPRRYGPQLLMDLHANGSYPTIVVLSACMTAGVQGAERFVLGGVHETAPLAATLVEGGIPIVVGMAGRVADITSRLFARKFGEAVIKGEPLVHATAQARQVAFADGRDPETTADWSFPSIFMAEDVDPLYTPVEVTESNRLWKRIEDWVDGYNLPRDPVFCGRETLLLRFQQLFEPPGEEPQDGNGHKRVLAVFASREPGIGRTRLLQECAGQAFRDGHLPVLLTFEDADAPRDLGQLARAVDRAIADIRIDVLALEEAETPQLQLVSEDPETEGLDPGVRQEIRRAQGELTARTVRAAMRSDLARLLADAREKIEFFEKSQGQIVVLFDDVDRYGPLVERFFAQTDGLLTATGLGTGNAPVPVVMACSLGGEADTFLHPIAQQQRTIPWLATDELGPFEETGEDLIAYQTVLLNPFAPKQYEDISGVAWAFNDAVEPAEREKWVGRYRKRLEGIPATAFQSGKLYFLTEWANDEKFVLEADDETWLANIAKRNE